MVLELFSTRSHGKVDQWVQIPTLLEMLGSTFGWSSALSASTLYHERQLQVPLHRPSLTACPLRGYRRAGTQHPVPVLRYRYSE